MSVASEDHAFTWYVMTDKWECDSSSRFERNTCVSWGVLWWIAGHLKPTLNTFKDTGFFKSWNQTWKWRFDSDVENIRSGKRCSILKCFVVWSHVFFRFEWCCICCWSHQWQKMSWMKRSLQWSVQCTFVKWASVQVGSSQETEGHGEIFETMI